MADFDELPEPGDPCPACGSLEKRWGLLGGEHCQRCDARKLDRSLKLDGRFARLTRGKGSALKIL